MKKKTTATTRRDFLKSTAILGGVSILPGSASGFMDATLFDSEKIISNQKSIIGSYGPWASGLTEDPPLLSIRRKSDVDLKKRKSDAVSKAKELISAPQLSKPPEATATTS